FFDAPGQRFTGAATLVLERLERHATRGDHHPAVCEIGQDAQAHPATAQRLDLRGEVLAHGVDRVGAHGVSHVDEEVDHEHIAHRVTSTLWEVAHLEVERAPAELDEHRVATVGRLQQTHLCTEDGLFGCVRVRDV